MRMHSRRMMKRDFMRYLKSKETEESRKKDTNAGLAIAVLGLLISVFTGNVVLVVLIVLILIGAAIKNIRDDDDENAETVTRFVSDTASKKQDAAPSDASEQKEAIQTTKSEAQIEPFYMFSGSRFKEFMAKYFEENGYEVTRITPREDNIDFIIEKSGVIIAVATKRTFELIQRSFVRNVIDSAKSRNIQNVLIITDCYFVPKAEEIAKEYHVELWDDDFLKEKFPYNTD